MKLLIIFLFLFLFAPSRIRSTVTLTLTPSNGATAGGTAVQLSQVGLTFPSTTPVTADFGAGNVVTCSKFGSLVDCFAPTHSAATVTVTLFFNGVLYGNTNTASYQYIDITVSSVIPITGPSAGNTLVTIMGSGFLSSAQCSFDGATVTTSVTATQITCLTPGDGGTSGQISMVSATNNAVLGSAIDSFGTTSFLYQDITVTSISPIVGAASSTNAITVTGTGFLSATNGYSPYCKFGSLTAIATVANGVTTSATCTAPSQVAGVQNFLFSNNNEDFQSSSAQYTYSSLAVTGISPSTGPLAGNTLVTITGSSMTMGSSTATCKFGTSTPVTASVSSTTTATCTAPSTVTSGGVTVQFSNENVYFVGTQTFTYQNYILTSITPYTGLLAGGNTVTLTGTGFVGGTADCQFGTSTPVTATVSSSTSATCVVPSTGSTGPVNVGFANDGQNFNVAPTYTYSNPSLTSFSPSGGTTLGGNVITLTGTGFVSGSAAKCQFGVGVTVSATVSSSTSATCTSPPVSAGPVTLSFSNDGTNFVGTQTYTFVVQTLSSISPSTGPTNGNTIVTLTGVGFSTNTSPKCQFGTSTPVTASILSDTTATCISPSTGTSGTTSLSFTLDGSLNIGSAIFLYQDYTLTSISPYTGLVAAGNTVTLTGTGFVLGTAKCKFGTSTPVTATVSSATTATCVVPFTGSTGPVNVGFANDGQNFIGSQPYTYSTPTLTSFSPMVGPLSGGTIVSLVGTGFVVGPSAICSFGSTPVTATVSSSTTASCFAPSLPAGSVTFQFSNDGTYFVGVQTFLYVDEGLAAILPATGPTTGNTTITLTGNGFQVATTPKCFIGAQSVIATVLTNHTATCNVPAETTGPVTVQFSYDGVHSFVGSPTYTFMDFSVSSISPATATTGGDTKVTLTGIGFISGSAVCQFGSTLVNATIVSNTQATCISPSTSVGNITLTYSNNGQNFVSPFNFVFANPTLNSISPLFGSTAGGSIVTLTGTSFVSGNAVCQFGSTPVLATVLNITTATCVTPLLAAGNVLVSFSNDGQNFVGSFNYIFYDQLIFSLTPTTSRTSGGITVNITGTGFLLATNPKCDFGNAIVMATVISPTIVSCMVPVNIGNVNVTYSNDGVNFFGSLAFSYIDFSLFDIAPFTGITIGGNTVTINGNGFVSGTAECKFGNNVVLATVVNFTQVTCVAPAGNGAVIISYSNDGQIFSGSENYIYSDPVVTGIFPINTATTGGAAITITGTGFISYAAQCKFGTKTVTAAVINSTTAICDAPNGTSGSVQVYFSNDGTYFSQTFQIFGYLTASLVSISPTTGAVAGGTTVTLSGQALVGANPFCRFGNITAPAVLVSGINNVIVSSVTCLAPSGTPGSVLVQFSYDGINYIIGSASYLYQDVTLTLVNPNNGPTAGNTLVTINGTGFLNTNNPVCQFGLVQVPANILSSTQATCLSPNTLTGSQSFSFSNNKQDFAPPQTFLFQDVVLNANAASPNNGIPQGGTVVTVLGSGFYNNPNLSCKFNTTVALAKFISPTKISCVAPTGSGSVSFSVSNNAQQFMNIGSYLYAPAPNTSSVQPPNANFGDNVTVTGGPYLPSSQPVCTFGGLVVVATFLNSTTISCTVPQGAGNVLVATSNNAEDFGSSTDFLFNIQEFALVPSNGKSNGSTFVTVIGSGFLNSTNLMCNFGNNSYVNATYVNITIITCLSPLGANGNTVLVSTSNDGSKFYGNLQYTYQDIAISSLSPSNGKSLGNTLVTVTGTGFINGSVQCQFTFNSTVIGNLPITAVYTSESQATLLTPQFVSGDKVSVNCSNNLEDYSNALGYLYQDIHVKSLSPTSGSNNGGTLITVITDDGDVVLDGSTVKCRFGVDGSAVVVASSTTSSTIGCVTPGGLNGNVEVFVTNNGVDWFDTGSAFSFNSSSSAPIAAIVGGVVGALVFLGLVTTLTVYLLKRKPNTTPKAQEAELDKIYRY